MPSGSHDSAPDRVSANPRRGAGFRLPIDPRLAAVALLLLGLEIRLAMWSYASADVKSFLTPWYAFARDHGWHALGAAFTNYAPFYSYLLIAVTVFDGHAPALLLIKAISYVFELATALLACRFVWRATRSRSRAAAALVACWLAPAVLYNGALWGQADSIWTFFIVLSVYLFSTGRNGVLPFGLGFAVKAQGVFLGPFVLGMLMRQRRTVLWLGAAPLVYLAIAAPTLIAGRPLMDVLGVYLDQANTYHSLSKHAGSLWTLLPGVPYAAGVAIGMALAAAAGLGIAVLIARAKRSDMEFNTLAACLSLLAMPFLLPKMHDRYFYAFEVLSIILACQNRRYLMVAMAAQVSAVLSYLAFDQGISDGVLVAAVQNLILGAFLLRSFLQPGLVSQPRPREVWGYGLLSAALACLLPFCREPHPSLPAKLAFLAVSALLVGHLGLALLRLAPRPAGAPHPRPIAEPGPTN